MPDDTAFTPTPPLTSPEDHHDVDLAIPSTYAETGETLGPESVTSPLFVKPADSSGSDGSSMPEASSDTTTVRDGDLHLLVSLAANASLHDVNGAMDRAEEVSAVIEGGGDSVIGAPRMGQRDSGSTLDLNEVTGHPDVEGNEDATAADLRGRVFEMAASSSSIPVEDKSAQVGDEVKGSSSGDGQPVHQLLQIATNDSPINVEVLNSLDSVSSLHLLAQTANASASSSTTNVDEQSDKVA